MPDDADEELNYAATFDWKPPAVDDPKANTPNAPVNDTEPGLGMKLYGVDRTFGRYTIEITDEKTKNITTYPKPGEALLMAVNVPTISMICQSVSIRVAS